MNKLRNIRADCLNEMTEPQVKLMIDWFTMEVNQHQEMYAYYCEGFDGSELVSEIIDTLRERLCL